MALLGNDGSSEWEVIRVQTYKRTRPISRDDQSQDLDVTSSMLDSDAVEALAKQIKLLLNRIPNPLQEVPNIVTEF